ncbi:MAG TPA: CaiB/BaiF CoA-transferase family protein, partial [Ilumatobacter sp.]|nr:CaiB/BaiF CoA-transferase family protein [Ilumatobacter sp.]
MDAEHIGKRPLDGVRVVDLTEAAPGQMCTGLLGDMGADVIRVQRTRGPIDDAARSRSILRNKRSLGLDLGSVQGKEILSRLVASADVLVEGMRPGALGRLGFGYDDVAERNPRIVYCSMSGYGQTGPYSEYPGYDLNFVGVAGYLDLFPNPAVPPFGLADFAAVPMHATIGILLALMARERIGVGQHVDISFADTTLGLLAATSPYRDYVDHGVRIEHMGGLFSGEYPFYGTYEAADGRWLSVTGSEHRFWQNLCRALGVEHLIEAGAAQPGFNARRPTVDAARVRQDLQQVFRRKTRDEWLAELPRHDV